MELMQNMVTITQCEPSLVATDVLQTFSCKISAFESTQTTCMI